MSEWVSAAEYASEVSSGEQANDWAVRANKWTDEQVAQYLHLDFWLFWPTVHRQIKKTEKKNVLLARIATEERSFVPTDIWSSSIDDLRRDYMNRVPFKRRDSIMRPSFESARLREFYPFMNLTPPVYCFLCHPPSFLLCFYHPPWAPLFYPLPFDCFVWVT